MGALPPSATTSAATSGLCKNDVLRIEAFAYLRAAVVVMDNAGLCPTERVLRLKLWRQRFDRLIADPDDIWIVFHARQHVVDEAANVSHRRWFALDRLERA